jgi:hypothetical protein
MPGFPEDKRWRAFKVRDTGADCAGMVTPVQPPSSQVSSGGVAADASLKAVARALRQAREEAQALLRLVEPTSASGDKGQHVNYYG